MLNLTRQERFILLFVALAGFLGLSISLCLKYISPTRVFYQTNLKGDTVLRINVNKATKEELATIDGVGEELAKRIIDYRNELGTFKSVEQLREVKGIGEKKFQKIKDSLFVDNPSKTP